MSAFQSFRQWVATSTLAHVAFGFLAMGAWAVFANRAHPLGQALLAGAVQGAISGGLTLVLKKALEWMSAKFSLRQAEGEANGRQPEPVEGGARRLPALIVPPLITASAIMAILQTAHRLAGTPEIWTTIAVPFTVSTSYAIIYNWGLWRRGRGGSTGG
jgi:hypothetical protein